MTHPPFANLDGRRALVTGASSGIGRAIALELARAGADVQVHCRTSVPQAEIVRDECRELGRASEILCQDLSDVSALPQFVEQAWQTWGDLNIWVNNAGADLLTGAGARLEYLQKLELLLDVDVRGTI